MQVPKRTTEAVEDEHSESTKKAKKADDDHDKSYSGSSTTTSTNNEEDAVFKEARSLGFPLWYSKYQHLSIKDKFRLLGFDKLASVEFDSPQEYFAVLKRAFVKKIGRRTKLPHVSTVEDVVNLLKKSKNIIVLTGAGISVSVGIPDFRSENGIYSRLGKYQLDDPQQMFDIHYFRDFPQIFYSFAKEIYPSNFKPSTSHRFIKLLQDKSKLLRNFTQNIDTLEQRAGITNVLQCHGSFATASCTKCKRNVRGEELEPAIFAQDVPYCKKCDSEDGIMKPDIVFFGESLPKTFEDYFRADQEKVDLLIVIGSSLQVSPVADVINRIPYDTPQVLINLKPLPHCQRFDVSLFGHCDVITKELCRMAGWLDDLDPLEKDTDPPNIIYNNDAEGFVFRNQGEYDDESESDENASVNSSSSGSEDENVAHGEYSRLGQDIVEEEILTPSSDV